MKISKTILPAAALVALFAGCQDENLGYTTQEVRNAKYAKTFEEMFGNVDPNQDWSMAKQVTASISGVEGDVLEIFYQNPISSDAVILARQSLNGGEATVSFDMAKNVSRVYVQTRKENSTYCPMSGYFNVVDGQVDFSNITRAQIMTGSSRMTKGEPYTRNSYILDPDKMDQLELYTGDAMLALDFIDGYYRPKANPEAGNVWVNYDNWYKLVDFTNFIPLNNVLLTTDERPEVRVSDITSFFVEIDGNKPLFTEKENHVKYMKEGSNPQLRKDLVFTMKTTGPMYLDYFFKGTAFDNTFGYFYYTGNAPTPEQFRTMPKYVLCDNMSTNGGTVIYGDKEERQDWDLLKMKMGAGGIGGIDGLDLDNENTYDNIIYGTRFQLTYFGANHDQAGVYEFPADTKIGLFILGYSDSERSPKGKSTGNATIFTSLSSLNLKMSDNVPHAGSFVHNGKIVYGMEDMLKGSDFDLNDMMFFVNGDFKEEEQEITPPAEHSTEIWIAACEDLGGTYDYDFNDIVFGLQKSLPDAKGASDLYFYPFAAGGTMKDEIFFNGTSIGEIHELLGATDVTTPLNVTAGVDPAAPEKITIATGIDGSLSINQLMSMVHIQATKDGEETGTSSETGKYNLGYNYDKKNNVPQVLVLPQGWGWPSEETCIDLIYSEFQNWSSNADVTNWTNTIDNDYLTNNPGKLIKNPIPAAAPSEGGEGGEGGQGGQGGGSTTPTTREYWNITLNGSSTIKLGTKETYTATVEGITDFTGLTVSAGTYNSTVAKVVDNSLTINGGTITFEVEGLAFYDVTIYVKVTGDDSHRDTRLERRINVIAAVPEFSFTTNGGNTVIEGDSYTLPVNPTNTNVDLGVKVVKGDGNAIVWSSSDESVVKVVENRLQRVACGTATITAKHKAVEGAWAELSKSIELTIAKIAPEFSIKDNADLTISVEEEKTSQFEVVLTTGDRDAFTFESTNTSVATVAQGGLYGTITGVAAGTAKIKVKHAEKDFYSAAEKEITVTVTASTLPVAEFTVTPQALGMEVDGKATFTVSVTNGDGNSLTCEIDDTSIIELDGNFNGVYGATTIKAKKTGVAHITITHKKTDAYKAHSEVITVSVGTAQWGDPIEVASSCIGEGTTGVDSWNNPIHYYPVTITGIDLSGAAGYKLIIEGSTTNGVHIFDSTNNYIASNLQFDANGKLEVEISQSLIENGFKIGCNQYNATQMVTINKLSISKKTIVLP